MMNIFKRLFRFLQNKSNAMVNNLEDPIQVIEEKLEDMRDDLSINLEHLRKIKAIAIRTNNDKEQYISEANTYDKTAIDILKKVKLNEISADEGDLLAKEALVKKEELLLKIEAVDEEYDRLEYKVTILKGTVDAIKLSISEWENELKTLKAEIKITQAEENINEQMATLNAINTTEKLELLKEKVTQYKRLTDTSNSFDDEYINLGDDIDFTIDISTSKASNELKKLKDQLDIKNSN